MDKLNNTQLDEARDHITRIIDAAEAALSAIEDEYDIDHDMRRLDIDQDIADIDGGLTDLRDFLAV